MRFRKIKFNNYRCFLNGELEFAETGDKNINLILGNNGAGKTEVLFAFWWLLYGFNFRQLKNKEATPYTRLLLPQEMALKLRFELCSASIPIVS